MMTEGIIVAVACALVAYVLSGARTSAYLFYFLSFVPFITLDSSAGGLEDASNVGAGNVMFKMVARVLTSAGFLLLFSRRRSALTQLCRVQSMPVVFFFCWALLSLHRAQVPLISFFRLGELLMFFLAGVVLFTESARFHGPRKVARWHCLALFQILLIALYFEQTRPELAYWVNADGIKRLGHKFLNSNTLGFASVAVALWSTVELKEKREGERHVFFEKVVPLIALGIALYVLLGARSRSAMITMVLGQGIVWFPWMHRGDWRRPAFMVLVMGGLVLALANFDAIATWFLRGESAADLKSGTGRNTLWAALLSEQLPRAPILGAGYLMLGDQGRFFHNGIFWSNAHNSYLFALIATGLPGFLALVTIALLPWLSLGRRLFTTPHAERPFWTLLFAMQSVILTASITGFGISGYPNPSMFFHYTLYSYAITRVPRRSPALRLRPVRMPMVAA